MATTPIPMSMRETLGIRSMRRLWYAQIVSNFGDFLALYAVIAVLTFGLHANAQQITGVQIAYSLPIAILGIMAASSSTAGPSNRPSSSRMPSAPV